MWWAAIPAAMGAVSSVAGGFAQADQMRATADEQLRRMRLENAEVVGKTAVGIGASGFDVTSNSLQTYLTLMTQEFRRQQDFFKSSSGRAADNVELAGILGGAASLGSAMNQYAAASKMFQTPKQDPFPTPTYQPGFGMPPWRDK